MKLTGLAACCFLSFAALARAADNPLEKLDWEGLIEDTETAPFKVHPKSMTELDVDREQLSWIRKHGLDAEFEAVKGTPEEKDRTDLLQFLGAYFADVLRYGIPAEAVDRSRVVVNGKERRPMTDFLCGLLLFNLSYNDGVKAFRLALAEDAAPRLDPMFRIIALGNLVKHCENLDRANLAKTEKQYFDELTAYLQTELPDRDVVWTVELCETDSLVAVRKTRERKHIEIFTASKLPEWARLTLAGSTHYQRAWRAGGNGMGVPEKDGAEKMRTNMADARTKLTRAWELKPEVPNAAIRMLRVAGVGGLKEGETLRLWLDRATASVMDSHYAFTVFFDVSRPYWSGSFADILAFGKVCAETGRYDSDLPTFFNDAVHRIAADVPDYKQLYQNPEISKLMLDTRRKRAAAAAGTPREMRHYTMLFFESWLAGDYDSAIAALEKTHRNNMYSISGDTDQISGKVVLSFPIIFRDTLCRASANRSEYEKGIAAFEKGNYAEAQAMFEAAKKSGTVLTTPLLDAEVALSKFQQQYAKGDWTALPLDEHYCWLEHEGTVRLRKSAARLRFESNWVFGKSLFRGVLGKNFEIRGNLAHSWGDVAAGLGIYNGHSPSGTGRTDAFWWTVRVDHAERDDISNAQFAPKWDMERDKSKILRIKTKDGVPFVYRCEGGKISFTIDGKDAFGVARIDADAPAGACAFGFGVLGQGKGSWADVWNLEARRLGP